MFRTSERNSFKLLPFASRRPTSNNRTLPSDPIRPFVSIVLSFCCGLIMTLWLLSLLSKLLGAVVLKSLVVLIRVKARVSPIPSLYLRSTICSGQVFVFSIVDRLFSINLEKVMVSPMPILYSIGQLFFG